MLLRSLTVNTHVRSSICVTGTALVLVTIEDVNDNPPFFPQSNYVFELPEDSAVGSVVNRTKAEDPDSGKLQPLLC